LPLTGIGSIFAKIAKSHKMKRALNLLICLIFGFSSTVQLSAQCTPDPNCVDIGEPGEYCPKDFPAIILDVAYDEVITFILALELEHNGTSYTIDSLVVDSVKNVPPGMTYSSNSTGYVPGKAYCSQLAGTPTEAGEFAIHFYLSPYIDLGSGPELLGSFLDDTSVVVTVYDPSGLQPYQVDEFQVLAIVPNPFTDITRLSFYTPFNDHVHLNVYNIMGQKMYEETKGAAPGEHQFEFTGNALLPGTYFYRVSNSQKLYTGKFIKTK
jgi:type IX secretion system substrate protein